MLPKTALLQEPHPGFRVIKKGPHFAELFSVCLGP